MSFRERLFRIARAEWSAAQRRLFSGDARPDFEPDFNHEDPSPAPSAADATLAEAYRDLELRPGASAAEAKRAYRRLMKRYHPDLFQEPGEKAAATRLVRGLRVAYERILAHEGSR